MANTNKTQVTVVGAGPAGCACAITLARAGIDVVLVERGNFAGAKNMFGGAIYAYPFCELYPGFENEAPIERRITVKDYVLTSEDSFVKVRYANDPNSSNPAACNGSTVSYSVKRSQWDKWCVKKAEEAGVTFVPDTLVEELLYKGMKIVGIKTAREEFFSDIVIVADGVNSILAKQAGLRKDLSPKKIALGVKEVFKLPQDVIESRLGLEKNQGCACEIFGAALDGLCAAGFVYTFKDAVAVGFGVSLDEFSKNKVTPQELSEKFKEYPFIKNIVKDGELIEYSAHLLPEGEDVPELFDDGIMLAGDAAMLINNVNFEGTNLAAQSGIFAAETAIEAFKKNDFSKKTLSLYKKKLENSYVLKDIKAFKPVIPFVHDNAKDLLSFYPNKINEFFKIFNTVGNTPKSELYGNFIKTSIKERGLKNLVKDGLKGVSLAFNVLRGGK